LSFLYQSIQVLSRLSLEIVNFAFLVGQVFQAFQLRFGIGFDPPFRWFIENPRGHFGPFSLAV
jgi:hypothetical protein